MPSQNNSGDEIRQPGPLPVWWSGFDYLFGYQLRMLQEFWGIGGSSD